MVKITFLIEKSGFSLFTPPLNGPYQALNFNSTSTAVDCVWPLNITEVSYRIEAFLPHCIVYKRTKWIWRLQLSTCP